MPQKTSAKPLKYIQTGKAPYTQQRMRGFSGFLVQKQKPPLSGTKVLDNGVKLWYNNVSKEAKVFALGAD